MRSTIQNTPDLQALYLAGSDVALLNALNVQDIQVLHTERLHADTVMNTFTAVVDVETGATEADQILGSLRTSAIPRVFTAYDMLTSELGLDMSVAQTQGMIEVFGGSVGWSPGLISRLKELGVSYQSLSGNELGQDATQADLDSYRAADAQDAADVIAEAAADVLRSFHDSIRNSMNDAMHDFETGDTVSAVVSLQDVIDMMEGA